MAVQTEPEVAGKPYRPLLDDTVEPLGAQHPLFVGDRLDTDIAGAVNAGLDSMLVLSGSHRADRAARRRTWRTTNLCRARISGRSCGRRWSSPRPEVSSAAVARPPRLSMVG